MPPRFEKPLLLLLLLGSMQNILFAQLSANFTYSIVCDRTVNFTNNSIGFTLVSWDFGDVNSSTSVNPSHQYAASGNFSVTLTVNNGFSNSALIKIITVYDPPGNVINGNADPCENSQDSYEATTAGNNYNWTVAGGTITNGQGTDSIVVDWMQAGVGSIQLIETNALGCSQNVQFPVIIHSNPSPYLEIWNDGFTTGGINNRVSVCSNSTENYGIMLLPGDFSHIGNSFQWEVTNGTILSGQNTDSISVLWNTAGAASLKIIETTSFGCVDSFEAGINVIGSPLANFSTINACLGSPVNFTDASTGQITNWFWNFGDGISSQDQNPTHVNSAPGVYNVNLTVTGAVGDSSFPSTNYLATCTDDTTIQVSVDLLPGPNIDCPGTLCAGETETYSTPAIAGATYNWNITGGTITNGGGSGDHEVTIQWGSGPTGTISLQVSGTGVYCSEPSIIEIPVFPANVNIAGPSTACRFSSAIYSAPLIPGATYNWTVVGGSISSGQGTNSININFSTVGNKTVILQMEHDLANCISRDTIPVSVLESFYISASSACANSAQTISVSGTPNTSGYPWTWAVTGGIIALGQGTNSISVNWGSGTTGDVTVNAPPGVYCKNSAQATITLLSPPPSATLNGQLSVCGSSIVSYSVPAGYTTNWSVAGGTIISGGNNSDFATVQWNGTGSGSVSVTQMLFGLCSTVTVFPVNFTNNTAPTISGPSPVCANTVATYSFTGSQPSNYTWDVTGGTIQSGFGTNTINVLWGDVPFGVITLFDNVCGANSQIIVNITGNSVPIIDTANVSCNGSSVTLHVPGNYSSYQWSTLATDSSINVTTPGTYSVTVTNSAGCTAEVSYILLSIPVLPVPVASITGAAPIVTPITILKLTAHPSGHTYSWSTGSLNQDIFVNTAGTYFVTVTNGYGCSDTVSVVVTISGGGISGGGGGGPPGGGGSIPCPALNPDFTNTNCNPVQFTNTSAPPATFYFWEFGDGSFSWDENPIHSFNATGTYPVKLYASDNGGLCWTVIQHNVTITSLLDANFIATQGCFGQPVQFTDASTSALPITNYSWDFGDSQTSLSQNPSNNYITPDRFAVSLTISDGICSDVVYDTVVIKNLTTGFEYFQACAGTPALFTDTSSGALPIVTWAWNFGDSQTSTEQNPQHQYLLAGGYNVTLIVTDIAGCTASVSIPVTVTQFNTGTLSYSGATTFCEGDSLILNAPAGVGQTYFWSTGESLQSLIVKQSGSYFVKVTDANGCVDYSDTVTVIVRPKPNAIISSSGPLSFCLNSGFPQLSAMPYATGFTYRWIKNGVQISTASSVYVGSATSSGNYFLIVTDNFGCKDTSDAVTVNAFPNPYPDITPSGSTVFCKGDSVTLTASLGAEYAWSNGSTSQGTIAFADGLYWVTVTDINGCSNSTPEFVTVREPPDMQFVAYGCYDVCISDSNRVYGPSGMSGYQWSNGATTSNILIDSAGTYNLTATNSYGCSDSSKNLYISITNFLGIDLGNDTSFCPGGSVLLNAGSGFSSYTWQDGSISQTYFADSAGNYFVSASDSNGCLGTDSIFVTVFPIPNVNLPADTAICSNGNYTLDAGGGFTSYLWNDSSMNQTFVVSLSGNFSVTVTDINGCTAADSTNLFFSTSSLSVNLGNDTNFCEGGVTLLDAGSGFISYTWQDGSIAQTYSADSAGNYFVNVTDSFGCSGTDSISVNVFQNPVLNLPADTFICIAGNYVLDGGNGFLSYLWSDSSSNQTIAVSSSGDYSLTVTDINGCSDDDTTSIAFSTSTVTVNLGTDTGFCQGDSILLDAGAGFNSYLWQNGNPNQSFVANAGGFYFVEVSDTNGCLAGDSILVSVFQNPNVNLPDDTTVCDVANFLLDAGSGFISYLWSDSSANQILNVSFTGNYSVTVTDNNGCRDSDTSSIMLSSSTFIITAGPDTTICSGDSVQLNVTGGSSYSWTPSATLNNSFIDNPVAAPTSTTTYFVSSVDSVGCAKTDSVQINVLPLLTAQAIPNLSICAGDSIQLSASGGTDFNWFPSTGLNCDTCSSTFAHPVQTATYGVIVSQAGYCNNDTAFVMVTAYDLPEVGLDSVVTISSGSEIILSPNGGMAVYAWSGSGLSCDNCWQPMASPVTTTIYTLEVTDSFGCKASGEILAEVESGCDGKFTIPTAFSPNGDGVNDVFRIIHSGDFRLITFKVFNRWGQKVFETDDPEKGWDGIFKDVGQPLSVFAYYVSMYCGNDINTIVGNVTLIR